MAEVVGIGALGQKFRALRGDSPRLARVMAVAGGGVLKKAARAKAIANGSRRTGAMVKNIAIKREKNAPAGTAQYNLGVRHGRDLTKKQKAAPGKRLAVNGRGRVVTRYADDPYYWGWVELGHKTVAGKGAGGSLRKRRAAAAGQVAAKPFIGPTVAEDGPAAIAAMEARLDKEIEKAASP
jgi:hypothetical protein